MNREKNLSPDSGIAKKSRTFGDQFFHSASGCCLTKIFYITRHAYPGEASWAHLGKCFQGSQPEEGWVAVWPVAGLG